MKILNYENINVDELDYEVEENISPEPTEPWISNKTRAKIPFMSEREYPAEVNKITHIVEKTSVEHFFDQETRIGFCTNLEKSEIKHKLSEKIAIRKNDDMMKSIIDQFGLGEKVQDVKGQNEGSWRHITKHGFGFERGKYEIEGLERITGVRVSKIGPGVFIF